MSGENTIERLIEQLAFKADDLTEDKGKGGVFDRDSERYRLACLAASAIMGGSAKWLSHPDKPGEPMVDFLMPWAQEGVVGAFVPVFLNQGNGRYYLLGGKRAAHLPRAGLFNWAGQGFKEIPPMAEDMPRDLGVLTALKEWHEETGDAIKVERSEAVAVGDLTLRGGYGGMFPRRDTVSLIYSALFLIKDPAYVAAKLGKTQEFDAFFFVEADDAINPEANPVPGMPWAFAYGDPYVAAHVLAAHRRQKFFDRGVVDYHFS